MSTMGTFLVLGGGVFFVKEEMTERKNNKSINSKRSPDMSTMICENKSALTTFVSGA